MLCELTVDLSFWFLKNHQNQKYVFWTQVLPLHWGLNSIRSFLWHYFCQKVPNDQINYKTQTKHHANTTVHHQIICTESFFNTGRQTILFLAISCSGLRLLFKFFLPRFVKVHIYWEGNKILWNLNRRFDCYYSIVRNKRTPMLNNFLTIFQRYGPIPEFIEPIL